jgi:hypothetical protein
MNYLLDTHTFLWFLDGNVNLSKKARSAVENSSNWGIEIRLNQLGNIVFNTQSSMLAYSPKLFPCSRQGLQ